jgi:hypothetical protein
MTTDFNKNAISSAGGFKPSTKDTPLDIRTRVETEADISSIPNPFVGMVIYTKDTGERYEVTSLKDVEVGLTMVSRVESYKLLESSNKIKIFDTVEEMKNANVSKGDVIHTLGYYKKNDGGGHVYEIVDDTNLQTEVVNVELNNGLKAKYGLGIKFYDINVLTIGVKRDDLSYEERNSLIIERVIELYNGRNKLFFPGGTYYISNINFTSFTKKTMAPEIYMYGEIISGNDGDMTCIRTKNKDFICDKRGIEDSGNITSLNLTMKDMKVYGLTYLDDGIPNGMFFGQDPSTLTTGQEVNFRFENVYIMGFKYGVYSPHWMCGYSGGKDISFSFCHCGIYVGYAMHCFNAENIWFNDCAIGIDTGWGGSYAQLKNIHVSTGYLGSDKADFEEYIGILTRGGVTLDSIYYEPYNDNGYMDRCILIKHEGYAFGIDPLRIKNTGIGYPGSGNKGKFLKSDCYLGWGYSRSDNPSILAPFNLEHYPKGAVIFENCKFPTPKSLAKQLLDINSIISKKNSDYKNIWFGYCFDNERWDSDLVYGKNIKVKGKGIMNKLNSPNSTSLVERINFGSLSDTSTITSITQNTLINILEAQFTMCLNEDYMNKFKIEIKVNGTVSSNVDVTFGIFSCVSTDNSTVRMLKKIKTIKGNEVYNDYIINCEYESIYEVDSANGENLIFFGYICNNGIDSKLTSADKNIIYVDGYSEVKNVR